VGRGGDAQKWIVWRKGWLTFAVDVGKDGLGSSDWGRMVKSQQNKATTINIMSGKPALLGQGRKKKEGIGTGGQKTLCGRAGKGGGLHPPIRPKGGEEGLG